MNLEDMHGSIRDRRGWSLSREYAEVFRAAFGGQRIHPLIPCITVWRG